ncbi:MAG TPA: protein kinase [Elusimicrobiales bacterium]|nr:protein kinase [Elusimicrobiales bacterium]
MMRVFLFIFALLFFNLDFIYSKDKKKALDDLVEQPNISAFFDSHYRDESNITDPERIIKSYRIIKKEPDKAADAFIRLMASKTPQEQRSFIEENYDKVSYLLFNLDNSRSDKFDDVFKVVVENSMPVTPAFFSNFESQAREILASYVSDFNDRMRRMPPNMRMPDISTTTLNYENPMNKLVEFARDVRRNPQVALDKANQISVNYSTNSSVQNGLARLFLDSGNYKEAEKYTTKAIEADDKNYDAYTMRAEARYSLKDIKGAIEDVKRASEIDPTNETAKLLASFITKSPSFSKTNFSSIKDSFSDSKADPSLAGDVEINVGDSFKSSKDGFVNSNEITADEKKSNYYLKNAMVKAQMEDYSEALRYLNMAIEKNPNNMDAYIERANTYNLIGNYEEAIKDATYVLRNDPGNIHALNIRAWALYKKGDLNQAYDDTNKAIDLKPNYADAMFLRSLIYEKQNRFDEMLSDLEKASRLNPNYSSKFHDAVASYAYKAPNFMKYYDRNKDVFKIKKEDTKPFNLRSFIGLLVLTVLGGIFIGVALLHAFSPKISTHTATASHSTQTDVIAPNIFYEGVATGKYKIIKKIGQGGMGSVYLAMDQTLNREVAVKKMNEDIKMNEREKQRFIEEARTVAMLHHPNIIEIYTIFEEKNDIYLVFEYIDGVSLDKKLDMEIRMPFYEVKEIVGEIAKALNYAHAKNVIHRDLKLSNVMVSKDGFVKVMDFGLAKVLREAKARYSSSEVVGSPAYMAPEQDLGIFVKESDLYSLGVCIYEMLSGELPFTGPDYHYQKEKKLYTPLSSVVVGIDQNLDKIISKLLEPKPEDRYHSVGEFIKDFNSIS